MRLYAIILKFNFFISMEQITIQDVRRAIRAVSKHHHTDDVLKSLSDEELGNSDVKEDLHMLSLQVGTVLEQLSKDKNLHLPHELHKVLPNSIVKSIVDTVNFCIQEEERLGIDVGH